MKKGVKTTLILTGVAGLLSLGGVGLTKWSPRVAPSRAATPLAEADVANLPGKAKVAALGRFIADHATAPDPRVQDTVTQAKLQLAYAVARQSGYAAARSEFLAAAHTYKGTGAMDADFGGAPDQAAYQAIVCLVPQGKTAEAKREFVAFLKDWPLSPLVHAAYKRLVRLEGGNQLPAYQALLERDVQLQQKHIRFEMSVCGPKTIAYILASRGNQKATDYKQIAKLCGTTDQGTTMQGMIRGLSALGVQAYAYHVNRVDTEKIPTPAIVLEGDHYLALLSVDPGAITLYNTEYRRKEHEDLPPLDDPAFGLNVLVFSPLKDSQKS
jgi:hypothetical protein